MNDFDNHLTPRQTETLELVAQGLTNDQIAHRMHIAPSTVKAQLGDASGVSVSRTARRLPLPPCASGHTRYVPMPCLIYVDRRVWAVGPLASLGAAGDHRG